MAEVMEKLMERFMAVMRDELSAILDEKLQPRFAKLDAGICLLQEELRNLRPEEVALPCKQTVTTADPPENSAVTGFGSWATLDEDGVTDCFDEYHEEQQEADMPSGKVESTIGTLEPASSKEVKDTFGGKGETALDEPGMVEVPSPRGRRTLSVGAAAKETEKGSCREVLTSSAAGSFTSCRSNWTGAKKPQDRRRPRPLDIDKILGSSHKVMQECREKEEEEGDYVEEYKEEEEVCEANEEEGEANVAFLFCTGPIPLLDLYALPW